MVGAWAFRGILCPTARLEGKPVHTVLSHNSALRCSVPCHRRRGCSQTRDTPLEVSQTSSSLKAAGPYAVYGRSAQRPVHILVSPTCRRRFHEEVRIHQTHHPRIPAGLLFEVSDDFYAVVQLTFLQMAGDLPDRRLGPWLRALWGVRALLANRSPASRPPRADLKARISEALAGCPVPAAPSAPRRPSHWFGRCSRSPWRPSLLEPLSFPTCLGGVCLRAAASQLPGHT